MEIYLLSNGAEQGPYSDEQIRVFLKQGLVKAEDLVWAEGLPTWTEIRTVPGLALEASTVQQDPPVQNAPLKHPPNKGELRPKQGLFKRFGYSVGIFIVGLVIGVGLGPWLSHFISSGPVQISIAPDQKSTPVSSHLQPQEEHGSGHPKYIADVETLNAGIGGIFVEIQFKDEFDHDTSAGGTVSVTVQDDSSDFTVSDIKIDPSNFEEGTGIVNWYRVRLPRITYPSDFKPPDNSTGKVKVRFVSSDGTELLGICNNAILTP